MFSSITSMLGSGLLALLLAAQLPTSAAQSTSSLPDFILYSSGSPTTNKVTIATAELTPSPTSNDEDNDEPPPSTPRPSTTNITPSPPARTHTIRVGLADHKFTPDTTLASVGDTLHFAFYPANHSVVRAAYEHPCVPYELLNPSTPGFSSGFFPVDTVRSDPPTWTIRVNDTAPIFFYCSAPGSCINYGMVGVVNPNATGMLERQREAARGAAYMLNPGEDWPDESIPPSAARSSAASSSGSGSGSGTSPSGEANGVEHHHHYSLSAGAIAGIAVAATGAVFCVGIIILLLRRRRRSRSRSSSPSASKRGDGHGPAVLTAPGYQYQSQSQREEPQMLESPGASGGWIDGRVQRGFGPRKYGDGDGEGRGLGHGYSASEVSAYGFGHGHERGHSRGYSRDVYGFGTGYGDGTNAPPQPGSNAPVEMEGVSASLPKIVIGEKGAGM